MASTPFHAIAAASAQLAATPARLGKRDVLVALLREVPRGERRAVVGWLVASPVAQALGVGPTSLWRLAKEAPAASPTASVAQVDAVLREASGMGRGEALARVASLFARFTEEERALFVGALTGSLRQGSLGGVMILALAELSDRPEAEVRRVVQLAGSVVEAAARLLDAEEGTAAAELPGLELFRPLAPMLAAHAESVEAALAETGEAVIEWKVDGVRAQIHKEGKRVVVFSRHGNDLTAGCAPLLDALRELRADTAVLDGEIALVDAEGKARPFQDSFSVVSSGDGPREGDRLRVFLFDCLHRDGTDLLDARLDERQEALAALAPAALVVPRLRTRDPLEAARFYQAAREGGHEGVMVKDPASPYRLGARGSAWQKVKEHVTVDLVVLAVEAGSGRRKGWLSNLHLGARNPDGTFCMVGKTFKGLTDALLTWQTEHLRALETSREGHVVHVRPELVVEIRFNDVQRSSRYPGGVALRFARVVRYREDKPASEVEPIEALVARLPAAAPAAPKAPSKREQKAAAAKKQLSLFGD